MDCLYASAYDNSQTGDSTDWTICARLVGDTRKSMTEEELKEREREHQKDLERLRRFRPMDDAFMRCLFRDNMPLA